MNKFLKISLTFLLFIFIFFAGRVFAVNIDLNLESNLADTATNSNVADTNNSNTISNDTSSNSISGSNDSTTESGTATFSNVSSLPESGLGLTNILNILLITVGIVLILLSIAILIRLKK